jgi:hypothetical protein
MFGSMGVGFFSFPATDFKSQMMVNCADVAAVQFFSSEDSGVFAENGEQIPKACFTLKSGEKVEMLCSLDQWLDAMRRIAGSSYQDSRQHHPDCPASKEVKDDPTAD